MPAADGWGCEISTGGGSKYVKSVTTSVNGMITVTAQGFNDTAIDDKVVTLTPLKDATTAAAAADAGVALFGWRCGNTGDGTTVPSKFLPGSCRG